MCELCNDTGYIPFVKDGNTIPNAWIDCQCREEQPPSYRETRPEDFDFPMSASFRELSFQRYGRPWECMPTQLPEDEPDDKQEVAPAVSQPWDKRQQYQMDQLRGEIASLRNSMYNKPQPSQSKPGYKGLVVK